MLKPVLPVRARAVILEAPLDSVIGVCASYLGLGISHHFGLDWMLR